MFGLLFGKPALVPVMRPGVVLLPSRNRTRHKGRRKIDLVVLHSTGPGGLPSGVDWLRKADRPNRTSAHYVVGKGGEVVQLVPEKDAAWHAVGRWRGRGAINLRSIGVELVNDNDGVDPFPKEQLESALWLCARTCKEWGLNPLDVIGHFNVDPKRKVDPAGFPWLEFRTALEPHV